MKQLPSVLLAGALPDEIRAWLDNANAAYLSQQAATQADHERLAELVRLAVQESQRELWETLKASKQ